jgi:flagellar hook-associated protein 3 FlgL
MRITNKVLSQSYLTDLNRNLNNMKKYQEQLSSGKEITRPSDNPFKVARSMELNTNLRANERYQENIDEASGWLDNTDSVLGQYNDVLQRVKELTIEGGNAAYSSTEKGAIKTELQQLKEQLVEIGNTVFDGRYIFNGDETTEKPFDADGKFVKGTVNGLKKEFAPGIVLDIAITGSRLSTNSEGTNVFDTLQNIIDKLGTNESPTDFLDDIDNHIDNALMLRGEVGAKSNRLETMSAKTTEENFNMTELLSKTEDIDFAQKLMEYSTMESVYTASLQTGAKILQRSLLDFLR